MCAFVFVWQIHRQMKRRKSFQGPAGWTFHWRVNMKSSRCRDNFFYLRLRDMVSDCVIFIVINSTAACKFPCADGLKVMAVIHQDRNDWIDITHSREMTSDRSGPVAEWHKTVQICFHKWLIRLICAHFNISIMMQWKPKIVLRTKCI